MLGVWMEDANLRLLLIVWIIGATFAALYAQAYMLILLFEVVPWYVWIVVIAAQLTVLLLQAHLVDESRRQGQR